MLQQQLAVDLGLDANATIFEICTAIDAQGLDIEAILDSLEVDLEPIVLAQITQLVNQIVIAIETITGDTIDPSLINEIIANIDIDAIVAQITANVQVSLGILEACLGLPPIPPIDTETLTVTKTTQCDEQEFGDICNFNPQITVTGTDPNPISFPTSQTPIVVTLGTGQYNVSEAGFVPGLQACSALGFDGGQQTAQADTFICTNFSEDCDGDISAGQNLLCNITNTVIDTNVTPQTATLNVTKLVTCEDENVENGVTCAQLLSTITEDQFNIFVTDNNSLPPFTGSETGTVVTLDATSYTLAETPDPSILDDIDALDDEDSTITGPFPSFGGDCLPAAPNVFSTTGIIAPGEQQNCDIVNHFIIEEDANEFTVASSLIIAQGTQDSPGLTALEKIEKLKKQWLDLVP